MATQLEPLSEVERLSKACIRILGGNPGKFTLQGTNTYLIGTGPKRLLIDTAQGFPSWKEALRRVLREEEAEVERCLITHWHIDHTMGLDDLLDLSPSTVVHKNQAGENDMQDISDGQKFSVQGATLTAVHSPGHTADHMSFVLEEEDAMFTGDNVLGHGTSVYEDLSTYLDSLAKMGEKFSGRAYPGHGPVIKDGPAKIVEYRTHRKQREDQVWGVLQGEAQGVAAKSSWGSMDIVKAVYKDTRPELYQAAEKGIIQILEKLEKDRKVTKRPDGTWARSERSAL